MTVKEVMKILSGLDEEMPVYFDCPNCGKANELCRVEQVVVVKGKCNDRS